MRNTYTKATKKAEKSNLKILVVHPHWPKANNADAVRRYSVFSTSAGVAQMRS
jgi:hypothetical protein